MYEIINLLFVVFLGLISFRFLGTIGIIIFLFLLFAIT